MDLPTINYEIGGADALSRHSEVLAVNFLKVVTRTLKQDRRRIHLSNDQIHWVLADAEGWVGGAMLENRQRGARMHLLKSLRHRPLQPRVARQLAKSMVPTGVRDQVRRAYLAFFAALGLAIESAAHSRNRQRIPPAPRRSTRTRSGVFSRRSERAAVGGHGGDTRPCPRLFPARTTARYGRDASGSSLFSMVARSASRVTADGT